MDGWSTAMAGPQKRLIHTHTKTSGQNYKGSRMTVAVLTLYLHCIRAVSQSSYNVTVTGVI